MDLDDFRSILRSSGVDLWTLMDTAISIASTDYQNELKVRRDGIVERLYAFPVHRCRNCDLDVPRLSSNEIKGKKKDRSRSEVSIEKEKGASPLTPQSMDREEEEHDRSYGGGCSIGIDLEQSQILSIKERLEDPDQSDDSLVNLLQTLADMDITFKALKETDIGRHVNGLRKHPSNEVRRLVKQLVRKWKELVDEWVKSNTPPRENTAANLIDGESPPQISAKNNQNGNQVIFFQN
eukprot:TRINITY_DN3672_c0_g1_i1.p1 TRINITY_DN3672_c0_g1~~TRINITY_DN3672_c0_g1_i1.p1  ORF type:complete len:237 (+),score=26.58 TRINITY_DN3672_c0_g1_i1:302-1012(+)